MRAVYTGHEALTFTDYIDLETGKTLHAQPGGVYDVAPASGRVVPEMPEPWFVAVSGEAQPEPDLWSAAADDDPEAAPDADPAPEDEQQHE